MKPDTTLPRALSTFLESTTTNMSALECLLKTMQLIKRTGLMYSPPPALRFANLR
jgi:hypothetical protein